MAKKKAVKGFDFGNFSASLVLKNMPFVLFLSFLAVIYIANAHYAEKKVRQVKELETDLKKLRWQYYSIQADLNFDSKRSEVVKASAKMGLKPSKRAPNKIIIKHDN